MEDDDSCLFDLPETSFLDRMSVTYPQLLSSWQSPPPVQTDFLL